MKRKLFVLVLMLASAVIILPAESRAAVTEDKTNSASEYNYAPQIRVQIGRGRRRGWQRRAWRRNQMRNRRARTVTRTYWRNGRRYTRVVRVY
jgi:hypothetical protein